jgi:hypothetical protein
MLLTQHQKTVITQPHLVNLHSKKITTGENEYHYKVFFYFSIPLIMIQLLQCDQQTHTLRQNYTVLIRKLLHVLGLTGPS